MSLFANLVVAAPLAAQSTTAPAQREQALDYALMKTSLGEIVLELNREKAPITVENFLNYTHSEFYDGTIYHRVINNFMIQGGGFTPDLERKPTDDPIKNEWRNGLEHERGTIAMARTNEPDSATSQFFINVKDNDQLGLPHPQTGNAAYCVFGRVIAGMKTVDAIKEVSTTTSGGMKDVPEEPVVIKEVRIISAEDAKKLIAEMADDPADSGDGG